jgi:hypothetical protein
MAQFDDAMKVTPVVPGQGLHEVFGCRRAQVRTMPAALMPRLEVENLEIPVRMHKEILEPVAGGRVIGQFSTGEPAVVANEFGKGRAIYIGTNPFIAYFADADPALLTWINRLNAAVRRPAWTDVPDVVARVLVAGRRRLLFLMNTLARGTRVTVSVPAAQDAEPTVEELLDGGPVDTAPGEGCMEIAEQLSTYGTKIYLID